MNILPFSLLLALVLPLATVAQTPSLSWTMQGSGTTAGLRGINSVDGQVAWASGTEGTILRTTDGGEHWSRCATPDAASDGATLDFRGIQAFDANTAIAMSSGPGDKSRLYKTTDACKTWALLRKNTDKDGFWDAISAADINTLILLGDPVDGYFFLSNSDDGGNTWTRDSDKSLTSNPAEGGFAASNSSILVNWVDGPLIFATGSPAGARLFRACDTCSSTRTWTAESMPAFPESQSAGIFSLAFKDWKAIIAAGGDYTKPNEATGTAAWSADGGLHWTASRTPPHGYRSTVQYSADLKAWVTAGTNGSDISRDDGKTWQPIDNGNWNALSLPFLVGPKGRIARLSVASAAH